MKNLDRLQILLEKGAFDRDVLDYIPGLQTISYQGTIYGVNPKKRYADSTCKDMQTLEFNI